MPVFRVKIKLGAVLCLVGVGAVVARWMDPGGLLRSSPAGWLYVGLIGLMMALVVFLGHYGGKVVFFWKKGRC